MKKTLLLALVPFLSGCGLLFVNGPPSNWQEMQDADQLETMALTQPCTANKGILLLDAAVGGLYVLGGVAFLADQYGDQETRTAGAAGLGLGGLWLAAAGVGNQKVNECRTFNLHLLELRRSGTSSLTSYEWLDEVFPLPHLGVTGLDPVFGVPINQDH